MKTNPIEIKDDLLRSGEIEKMILGEIIIDNNAMDEALLIINQAAFFFEYNRILFSIMIKLHESGLPIDAITLYAELEKSGKKDFFPSAAPVYISSLASEISSAANINHHCKILKDRQVTRDLLKVADKIYKNISCGVYDALEIHSVATFDLENVISGIGSFNLKSLWDELPELLTDIEKDATGEKESGLISNSFPYFNKLTGGIKESDFVVIYGREKQGKTTLTLQLLLDYAIDYKIPVAIFSLEMNKASVQKKCLSYRTGIKYMKLRSPKLYELTQDEFNKFQYSALKEFENSKIYTFDELFDKHKIKAAMKYMKNKVGVKVFAIDYISLLESHEKHERNDLRIADISRYFKQATQELKVPIFMLSQSNKENEVADSKALARDADFVFSIKKPLEQGLASDLINGQKFYFKEDHFQVTLERSRHGKNRKWFLCGYTSNNYFKELDPKLVINAEV